MSSNDAEIFLKLRNEFSERLGKAKADLDELVRKSNAANASTKQSFNQVSTSAANASAAVRGLANQFGVELPAAVSRFASQSATIGPLLTTAFKAVVVLELVRAIRQLPEAIDDAAGALTGWNDAAKKAYDSQISLNDKYVDRLKTTQQEIEKMAVAAQKAAAATSGDIGKPLLPGLFGSGVSKLFGLTSEESKRAVANEQAAKALGFEATANMGKPGWSAFREALQGAIDAQDKLAESARKARQEREALLRSIGAFVPAELPLGFSGGSRQFHQILDWPTPPMNVGALSPIAGIDFEDSVSKARAASEAALQQSREFANRQAEIVGDAQIRAAKDTFEKQKRLGEDLARSLSDSFANVWDDMFIRGKNVFSSLGNFFAGIGNVAGRSAFSSIGSKAGNAISGLPIFGRIAGALGFGGAAATTLGSTTVASLATGPALAGSFGLLPAAAPIALGGGIGAGLGGAGGATILGLAPALGATVIGAGIALGAYGLYRLFRHKTQEAPFTTDPFRNQKTRTYEFYAMDRLTNAIDRFTNKFDAVDEGKILASAKARRAIRDSIRTSQSEAPGWAMDTGAAFNGGL